MTLSASARLLRIGANSKDHSTTFSTFTGSMILSIASMESFLNSLGSLSIDDTSWENFEKSSLQDKLSSLCSRYFPEFDTGKRPFQTIKSAVKWRNLLLHSKPDFLEEHEIYSMDEVRSYSKNRQYQEYEKLVNKTTALRFYGDIVEVIQLLIKRSGIDPRAQGTYAMS